MFPIVARVYFRGETTKPSASNLSVVHRTYTVTPNSFQGWPAACSPTVLPSPWSTHVEHFPLIPMGALPSFQGELAFAGVSPGTDPLSKQLCAQCLVRRWLQPSPGPLALFIPAGYLLQYPPSSLQLLCISPSAETLSARGGEKNSHLEVSSDEGGQQGCHQNRSLRTHSCSDSSVGCNDWKQMALLTWRKRLSTCLLSVCPSRLGCGVQLTVSTSLRLPKAEVLMSPTL